MEEKKKKRIGVYICHCGGNISDYVDVAQVRELAGKDDFVVVAKDVMFACADSNQKDMVADIKEQGLDAIVVASCSPKLHLHTFRNVALRAGLNQYQYVQVNVREQCSWPHHDDRKLATGKAAGLVEAGIRRVMGAESHETIRVSAARSVLIVGAGVAGMRAAISLASIGNEVVLVEKAAEPGGKLAGRKDLFPGDVSGESIVQDLAARVRATPNIKLFCGATVSGVCGSMGQFQVKVNVGGQPAEDLEFTVGAVLIATGFDPYKPEPGEYSMGSPGVIPIGEFVKLVESGSGELMHQGRRVRSVGFIYCVGMRQTKGKNKYCSRVCCSGAIQASLSMHRRYPGVQAYHFYRDIRAYGKQEVMYTESSKAGDVYFMFTEKEPPVVTADGSGAVIKVKDSLTKKQEVEVPVDLVVLVTGMVPQADSGAIAASFKVPISADGFFNEIHPKLRPVETVINGVFLGGSCQGPKNVTETLSSALAASAKINAVIGKGVIDLDPVIARVDSSKCVWCGKCAAVCEYGALVEMERDGRNFAIVDEPSCVGCGVCAPVCPTNAIELACFTDAEIEGMIDGFALDQNINITETAAAEESAAPSVTMKEYPAQWHMILEAMKDGPISIPDIAKASGLDASLVTRHVMTMNRYRVAEPAGLDDSEQYYLYQQKS